MPTTTTFNGAGMSLRQKLAAAGEIACQTCPTCGGSGSGGGGGQTCISGTCNGTTLPPTLILSLTESVSGPTGDFVITFDPFRIVNRDLDQSEQPCLESDTSGTGYFSEEYYIGTESGCDLYLTYYYEACEGFLYHYVRGCNPDCPDNNPPLTLQFLGQASVTGCSPYLAVVSNSPFAVGSISE